MTFMAIKSFFLALWLLLLLPTVCNCHKQEVAVLPPVGGEHRQFHRSLAAFVLPFQIRWKFEIADIEGIPEDRQPTPEEYDGIRQATIDWFTIEIPFVYVSEDDFSFREIDCQVEDTIYDPNSDNFVHDILLGCQVIWDADTIDDIPDTNKFLTDLNAPYLLDNFVEPHLREADPQNPRNIFQFSQRVRYETNGVPAAPAPPTDAPMTTDEPVTTVAPTIAPPVTPPPQPQPTPPPTPGNTMLTPTPGNTMAPANPPSPPGGPPTDLPQKKVAPPAKCGSIGSNNDRGGAAADAKDCSSRRHISSEQNEFGGGGRRRKRRKLKGATY